MTSAVRQYVCPYCDGNPVDRLCICDGYGLVSEATALQWADVFEPKKLPDPPATMDAPCSDCAFRGDSPEHEDSAARAALLLKVEEGAPFYCHQGMHYCTDRGLYVPFASDAKGEPVGHPVCAGWTRARERLVRLRARATREAGALDDKPSS